ncbi:MAG: macro domain-containing protein [Clostridiales bacterium]|nr:macro domain-containing protein [Clostridiales bacterium]
MTQDERRIYLIGELLSEEKQYRDMEIPADEQQQKRLLRALFNIRMPKLVSSDFLEVQDQYLQEELQQKGITDVADLTPVQDGIYLWQGDITTLRCGAIVNAANSQMLGCFCPNHGCIDNAIHTYAGVQLRAACAELMAQQGHEEMETLSAPLRSALNGHPLDVQRPHLRSAADRFAQLDNASRWGEARTGDAKITPAFNLPCDYVIHTVGPIVSGRLTVRDKELLASCYRSCLELADQNGIRSIAFCCISTGEFHFPNERAAQIAVKTVKKYKEQTHSEIEVILNVFKDDDLQIYRNILR